MSEHLGSLIIEKDLTVREVLQIASLTTQGQILTITDSNGTVGAVDALSFNRIELPLADLGTGTLAGDFNIQNPDVTITQNDLIVVTWAFTGEDYLYMGPNGSFGIGGPDTAISSDFYLLGNGGTPGTSEFVDTVFRILNGADNTKQIAFSGASIAPNTTRTILMPNYDVDLGNLLQPPQVGILDPNSIVNPRYEGDIFVNSVNQTSWIAVGVTNTDWRRADNVKSNQDTVDPTILNDSTEGYEPYSLWINTNTNDTFICKSSAIGAADWISIGSGAGGPVTLLYNVNQIAHGFTVDQFITLQAGASLYILADAIDNTKIAIGMVVNVIDVDNFQFQNVGQASYTSAPLVSGTGYYLSQVPGAVSSVQPLNYIQSVFSSLIGTTVLLDIGDMFVIEDLGNEFMLKSVYDPDDNGIVNNSEALNGRPDTDFEDYLGLPSADGDILSSTMAGVRTWITPGAGGGGNTTQDITATITVGAITNGTLIPTGTSLTGFIQSLLAPVIQPTKTNNSVVLNGITTSTIEIGTPFVGNLTTTYNRGTIINANAAPSVFLTGAATTALFSGAGVNPGTGAINTPILVGTNQWSVDQSFAGDATPYYDSNGIPSNIFDALRGPTPFPTAVATDTSNIITGKYKYWYALGTIPVTSAGVRALPNSGFYPVATFNISIPANQPNVAFYLPDTFSNVIVQYVESSNADVTSTFIQTAMTVNDGGGTPINYVRFVSVIGGGGYPSVATYKVTVTP